MTHSAPLAKLSALMLACAFLAACGGGDAGAPPPVVANSPAPTAATPPDTTPPTVTIANDVSAPTANGPVTFTFVFSEDVGISFNTTDVVVTGGTASAFNRISGSQATVLVTPPANSTGTITVSIAPGTFTDLQNNANTVGATASKDFNTKSSGGSSGAIVSFDETTAPKLTDFGTNGAPPVIATDPAGGTNKVLKVFKYKLPAPGSEQWAGVTVSTGANDTIPAIPFTATAKTMTVRMFSPAAGVRVRLKVENAASLGTVSCETDALTTTSGAWETLTFNFANPGLSPPVGGGATSPLDLTKSYDKVSIFSDFGIGNGGSGPLPADRVYYYDDITFVASGGGGGGGTATAPTTAPSTVIPVGSTVIYSDAAKVAGFDSCPNWGQATVCAGEQTIAGNKVLKYTSLNYEGLDWSANAQDVSTKSKLHIDFWSPDVTSVKVSIISPGPKESAVTQVLTTGVWNGVDIDLAQYTVPDKTAIIQIKLESTTPGTLYVDNIYFSPAASASCGTTDPTCAPTTAVPAGSIVIYSDAAAVTGLDSCPNWGQATVCGGEQTIAGNKVLKYSNLNYEGLDWSAHAQNVSTKGKLHMDFWTPDLTSVQVFIISPGPKEGAFTQALTTKGWNTVDIPLSNYTVPDQNAIIQIKLVSTTPGTLFVDNIYFWDAPAGSGGAVPDMGSGGPVTIPVATAGDKFGFILTGDAIFASDYIGPVDSIGNHALFAGATTTGTPSGGAIGYFNDPALSTSAQKLEEGGWVSGSIDQQGVPNFFRYFVLTGPGSTFASSYMGLFANAPGNGTVDVSAYASIKFLLWGPAGMYEQSNFNPSIEVTLAGPKVAGCVATGSGGTEITQTFSANKKIGAASSYKLAMSGFTIKGLCGTDTNSNAVANVKAKLARVVVNVPAGSFNFTNANANSSPAAYSTGVNMGPIGFTNQ